MENEEKAALRAARNHTPLSYSIQDAAYTLGIGRTTLYRLINQRQLSPIKIGKRTLIAHQDIADLLERKKDGLVQC